MNNTAPYVFQVTAQQNCRLKITLLAMNFYNVENVFQLIADATVRSTGYVLKRIETSLVPQTLGEK